MCHNVSFVINLSSLDDPNNLPADENVVWNHQSAPIAYVSIYKPAKVICCTKMHSTLIVTSYQEHIIDTQAPQISTTKLVLYKVRVYVHVLLFEVKKVHAQFDKYYSCMAMILVQQFQS